MDKFEKEEEDRKLPPSENNKTTKINTSSTEKKTLPVKKSATKKNKKKSQQTDGMPIRPLSAYNLFFRDERARLLKAREEGNPGEIGSARAAELFSAMGKTIAKRWRELPAEERVVYTTAADKDSKRYQREKEEYKLMLLKINKETITEKKQQAKLSVLASNKPSNTTSEKSSASGTKSQRAGIVDNSQNHEDAAFFVPDRANLARVQLHNTSSGVSSQRADFSDHCNRSEVAAMTAYDTANLARLQLQSNSTASRLTAASEQPSNIALLRAAIIAREQTRIDEVLRAQQIRSLLERSNIPSSGSGQRNPLPSISSLTSQELYLASLSNSLGTSTIGGNFRPSQNEARTIQKAAVRQEWLNAYTLQQAYNSQLALASEQQQLLQRALGQASTLATNTTVSTPLINQLLSQQNQGNDLLPSAEGNDETSDHGNIPDSD